MDITGSAHGIGESNSGPLHLGPAAFSAELPEDLIYLGCARSAYRMALGLQTSIRVNSNFAADHSLAPGTGFAPLAVCKESQALHSQDFGDGEAVMHLANIDILGCDPGHFIGLL